MPGLLRYHSTISYRASFNGRAPLKLSHPVSFLPGLVFGWHDQRDTLDQQRHSGLSEPRGTRRLRSSGHNEPKCLYSQFIVSGSGLSIFPGTSFDNGNLSSRYSDTLRLLPLHSSPLDYLRANPGLHCTSFDGVLTELQRPCVQQTATKYDLCSQ